MEEANDKSKVQQQSFHATYHRQLQLIIHFYFTFLKQKTKKQTETA